MKQKQKQQKGITLIALVITIIVLLILAGVSLYTIFGEEGLIARTQKTAIANEIAGEKETLTLAVSATSLENLQNNGEFGLKEGDGDKLKEEIEKYDYPAKEVKSAEKEGYLFVVTYESDRSYYVKANGSIDAADSLDSSELARDNILQIDEVGNYLIYKIEDLVEFSNVVKNGDGSDEYFPALLCNDLDFESESSYYNKDRTDFGDLNGDGTTKGLMAELTERTGADNEGFIPIGDEEHAGVGFNGDNYSIDNLYIKTNTYRCIGLLGSADSVENLTVSGEILVDAEGIERMSGALGVCVGGIAGVSSIATGCTNEINITVNDANSAYIGGIVGIGKVQKATNKGNITAKNVNDSYISGIGNSVGNDDNEQDDLNNCAAMKVTGERNSLSGLVMGGRLSDSSYEGEIQIIGNDNICGGVSAIGVNCSNVRSSGAIYIDGTEYDGNFIGGIFGSMRFTNGIASVDVSDVTFDGYIDGNEWKVFGAIIGMADWGEGYGEIVEVIEDTGIKNVRNDTNIKCLGCCDRRIMWNVEEQWITGDNVNHFYLSSGGCAWCSESCEHRWNGFVCGYHEHGCEICGHREGCTYDYDDLVCDMCCIYCVQECMHDWSAGSGFCLYCGKVCEHECGNYEDLGWICCADCGLPLWCAHTSGWYESDGVKVCSECGEIIDTDM